MSRRQLPAWLYLVVLGHLALGVLHGTAHSRAAVPLSTAATAFVFLVILIGPPAGLALRSFAETAGAWTVAATMAASLVFGLVNHFILASPDHVMHVDPQSRLLFGSTAILLAATELAGAVLATRLALERRRS